MFEPMGIAILFRLLFATALTLTVVPVLYTIPFGVRFKGFKWNGPAIAQGETAAPPAP